MLHKKEGSNNAIKLNTPAHKEKCTCLQLHMSNELSNMETLTIPCIPWNNPTPTIKLHLFSFFHPQFRRTGEALAESKTLVSTRKLWFPGAFQHGHGSGHAGHTGTTNSETHSASSSYRPFPICDRSVCIPFVPACCIVRAFLFFSLFPLLTLCPLRRVSFLGDPLLTHNLSCKNPHTRRSGFSTGPKRADSITSRPFRWVKTLSPSS